MRELANIISISRLGLGFLIVILLESNKKEIAFLFFLLGGLTDVIDGWIARKADGGSKIGAILDPLTDKIFIIAPFLWLVSQNIIPAWSLWLLISREIIISAWRSLETGINPASLGGKLKTFLQFISISLMIWPIEWGNLDFSNTLNLLGYLLYWPSLVITIYTGVEYLKSNRILNQN